MDKPYSATLSPFVFRHIGPRDNEIRFMLSELGYASLDELTLAVVPENIADNSPMDLLAGLSEEEALSELKQIASKNKVLRSFIGQGYYGTFTPKVIQRNVLENPAWYTAYTPYQPEISQGRLEVLFYFQTMVCELTGMDISGASLLDEGTAAAEAMTLCQRSCKSSASRFLVSSLCHPQTIELIQTRAEHLESKSFCLINGKLFPTGATYLLRLFNIRQPMVRSATLHRSSKPPTQVMRWLLWRPICWRSLCLNRRVS